MIVALLGYLRWGYEAIDVWGNIDFVSNERPWRWLHWLTYIFNPLSGLALLAVAFIWLAWETGTLRRLAGGASPTEDDRLVMNAGTEMAVPRTALPPPAGWFGKQANEAVAKAFRVTQAVTEETERDRHIKRLTQLSLDGHAIKDEIRGLIDKWDEQYADRARTWESGVFIYLTAELPAYVAEFRSDSVVQQWQPGAIHEVANWGNFMDRRLGALVNVIRELRQPPSVPQKPTSGPVSYLYQGVRWLQASKYAEPLATCPDHEVSLWFESSEGGGVINRRRPFARAKVYGTGAGHLVCPDGGDHWLKAKWDHPFGTIQDQAMELMAKLWG